MGVSYRIDAYDTSNVKRFVITDFLTLALVKGVNEPGTLSLAMAGGHTLLAQIQDKWHLEVWRRPVGGSWTRELVGLYRDFEWAYDQKSRGLLICQGLMSMLGWRIVNWPAGKANRSRFLAAKSETIMKTLVNYNCAASATTGNGRKRTGTITGLTVQTDGANGNTRNWYCHGENILENLQKLALVAGGDFDLVKTSASAWEFRWYTGQLGTDRTATLTFGMDYGNMGSPFYSENRIAEKTVACVWGQGHKAFRDYVTRTGTNYAAGNDIEIFVDANDIDKGDTTGLNDRGDRELRKMEATKEFSFEVLQTPSSRYGLDYFLGDKVTTINPATDATLTQKIMQVALSIDESGKESIQPEMSTLL